MNDLTFSDVQTQLFQLYQGGEYTKALDLATRAASQFPAEGVRTYYWRVCMASLVSETALALQLFEEALEAGFWYAETQLRDDPDLQPLPDIPISGMEEVETFWRKYVRMMNLGLDYTFGLGNGLYALCEHFRFERTEEILGKGEGVEFSALSLNYPLGLIDNVTGMVYYDWENHDWYRFVNWQRTYDDWSFYFIGFWNPEAFQIYQNVAENNLFAGKGVQFMVIFNH